MPICKKVKCDKRPKMERFTKSIETFGKPCLPHFKNIRKEGESVLALEWAVICLQKVPSQALHDFHAMLCFGYTIDPELVASAFGRTTTGVPESDVDSV